MTKINFAIKSYLSDRCFQAFWIQSYLTDKTDGVNLQTEGIYDNKRNNGAPKKVGSSTKK